MNLRITLLSLVLLASCQAAAPETNNVEQAVTGDCVPGNNFAEAKMPALPLWDGKTPVAGEGQIFLDVADWRKNGEGFHVAVLADPGKGEIVWGATISDEVLGSFRSGAVGPYPIIGDCCRPPPCGCRGCCDDWMTPNLLEASLRYIDVPGHAAAAVKY